MLKEARALLDACAHSTDAERTGQMRGWVESILSPLVEARVPEALWLKCAMQASGELNSEDAFTEEYWAEVRKAADAGSVEAKFSLACELDEDDDTVDEAAALFREAAEADHAYAQWCHALNLLAGRGVEQDRDEGVRLMKRSAEQKFEGAIVWMANALELGTYGLNQDEAQAARWQRLLAHKDVIPY